MGKLTVLGVKNAKPGKHHDGGGLTLVVKQSGARSWIVRVQWLGRRRDFGLGSADLIGLSEARERALETRKQVRGGIDPLESKRRSRAALKTPATFKEVAELAHIELSQPWKNPKHREQWISTLRAYAFPRLGQKHVNDIDAGAIIEALEPIWSKKEETARRVRQRICTTLDWAHAKGWRDREAPHHAISKGLPRQKGKRSHFRALAYSDLPAFFGELAESRTISKLALRFLILTAARSGEVRGARWSELDFEAREWRVPAHRMKAGKEHIVPLSDAAIEVLRVAELVRLGDEADIVFPSPNGKAMSDMTLTKALRSAGQTVTVHGFRSTFSDWAAQAQTQHSDAVIEAALAHSNPNRVQAAYRRTDFLEARRDLMASWANFVAPKIRIVTTT